MKRASEKADPGKRRAESESPDRCPQDGSQIASFCPREGLFREDCRLAPAAWGILREEFAMGNPRRDRCAEPPHSEGAVVRGLATREAMGCFRFGDWAGLRYALSLRKRGAGCIRGGVGTRNRCVECPAKGERGEAGGSVRESIREALGFASKVRRAMESALAR